MTTRVAPLAARRRGSDAGFTLPELLVTMVIMAVIVAAIASAVVVSLKTQTATAGALDESHDEQRLALWLPRDLESAVQSLVDVQGGTGTGCAGPIAAGSTNLLRLTITDVSSGSLVTYYSSYRVEGSAAPYQLVRYSCRSGQAYARQVMIANLPTSGSATVTITGAKVTMSVTTAGNGGSGLTFSVSGTPRTPVLGGGSNGGTSCVMANGTLTPSSVGLNGSALSQDVAVSVTTTGACSGLSLQFDPGQGGSRSLALAGGPSTWTATIAAASYTWTSGTKALLVNGTSNSGTLTLAVGSTCSFQNGAVNPGSSATQANGTLTSSLVITVNTVGCPASPALTVAVDTGGGLKPAIAMTGGPDAWTLSLPNNQYNDWSVGSHPFTVGGIPSASPTLPFTILGPCTYVSGDASPDPVTLGAGGTLATSLAFTVNTTGFCGSGVSVTVRTGSNPSSDRTVLLGETPVGSGVWRGTVTAAQYTSWTTGTKNVTVAGTTNGGSFHVGVQAGCAFVSGAANPNPATVTPGGTLTSALVFTVTTTGACSALSLTFPTATSDSKTVALTGGPTSWTATVAAGAYSTWTVGTKTATVAAAAGGTFTFAVQNPPCTFVSGSATPTAVQITDAAGHLSAGFAISVTTSGVCSGLTISLPTSPAGGSVALAGSGTSWSASVGPSDFTWTAGAKALTVNGTTNGGSIPLTINPACTYVSGSATPNPVNLTVSPGNTLATGLTLSVTTSGPCASLAVTFVPGSTGTTQTLPMIESAPGSGSWSVAVSQLLNTWTAGAKTATVNATIPGSFGFTVQTPCTYQSGTAAPGTVGLAGNGGLLADVALTVTTTGTCASPLTATIPTGGTATAAVTFAQGSPGSWTATIAKQAYTTWTVGAGGGPATKTVTLAGTANAGSFTFIVNLVPCAASPLSVTPSPVNRLGNGTLQSDLALAATTTGTCAGVNATVNTGTVTPPAIALTESAPGSGSWTATVAKAAYTWTAGAKTFTFKDSNNNTLGTAPLMVNDLPCTFSTGAATPNPVSMFTNGAKAGQLQSDLTISVTTSGVCSAALTITFSTSGAGTSKTLTLTESPAGSGAWSVTILKAAYTTWTATPKTATVANTANGGTVSWTVA